MEVQRGNEAEVVVAVVVPVVDVKTVRVEVADIDAVTIGVENLLVFARYHRKA